MVSIDARKALLPLGLILVAAGLALGLAWDSRQTLGSYLFAYLFWLGIALGSLGMMMVWQLTGGPWGEVFRPALQAAAKPIWVLLPLFLPVLCGMRALYEWTDPVIAASDPIQAHKSGYLNPSFFIARAILYFAVWIGLAHRMASLWSRGTEPASALAIRRWSAAGILLYAVTLTFAAVDWVMSLEAHWYSTIYGLILLVGQGLSAAAFAMVVAGHRRNSDPVPVPALNDAGNILLVLVMVWAYVSYAQLLVVWMGNLPHETEFFKRRWHGGWATLSLFLVFGHFAVPFFLLLHRRLKRSLAALGWLAAALLAMRALADFWLVIPAFHRQGPQLRLADAVFLLGIGGIYLGRVLRHAG